jgi:peptidyl-dipeptidase A
MERGSSASWSQILQETIGEGRLNGEALRDYFRPLEDWLRSENLRTGEYLGWSYDGDYCKFRYLLVSKMCQIFLEKPRFKG